jgi:micrococcal nuclease
MNTKRIRNLLDQIRRKLDRIATQLPARSTGREATVTHVTDGDSFDVEFDNGETDTIRLLGVDTPEVMARYEDPSEYNVPDTDDGMDWCLQWGARASDFVTRELQGQTVRVIDDPQTEDRGYFDRKLAYVHVDGVDISDKLLRRGYARVYTGEEFEREDDYLALEADAQDSEAGVWGYHRYR